MLPLVLLPGMMCDGRMWGDLPAALAPRSCLHVVSTKGHSTAEFARAVLEQAPERFALAGLSMGGIIAMEIVAMEPQRVERLALLDTNPLAEGEAMRLRRATQIARALAGDLLGVMRDEMKPNYLADPGNTAVLDLCLDMALTLGAEVFRNQSLALRDRPDRTTVLASFKGPSLVLMGAEDRLCPHDRHALMHALMPQSHLVTIPHAGHLPPLEQPGPTLAALRAWLAA